MSPSSEVIIAPEQLPALRGFPIPYGATLDHTTQRYARIGWTILGVFFGIFGLWAMIAPLNGAVVSTGIVKVEGNRKTIQHLDGGIVKRLNIKEGDHVNAGDVLIELDDSEARAEFEVYSQQQLVLRATEARLMAELNHARDLAPPPDIASRLNEQDVTTVWNGQLQQFVNRQAALAGEHRVIQEKINQLQAQIGGTQDQITAYQQQSEATKKELDLAMPLAERGLITQPRLLQLQRNSSGLTGQIGATKADIAKFREGIAEQSQQVTQIDADWMANSAKDLRDTQALLLEVIPKLANAKAILERTQIRSPYTGKVVGLSVFAVGAVIQRGDKILDVVPDGDALTVEAQIPVDAISDVRTGIEAEVRLTAYKQRITPTIHGKVQEVSADRLTDPRTGTPYYTALVRLDPKELAALPGVNLYPGMPADVMIPTVRRTAFDYLVGPLAMSFNNAFRQK